MASTRSTWTLPTPFLARRARRGVEVGHTSRPSRSPPPMHRARRRSARRIRLVRSSWPGTPCAPAMRRPPSGSSVASARGPSAPTCARRLRWLAATQRPSSCSRPPYVSMPGGPPNLVATDLLARSGAATAVARRLVERPDGAGQEGAATLQTHLHYGDHFRAAAEVGEAVYEAGPAEPRPDSVRGGVQLGQSGRGGPRRRVAGASGRQGVPGGLDRRRRAGSSPGSQRSTLAPAAGPAQLSRRGCPAQTEQRAHHGQVGPAQSRGSQGRPAPPHRFFSPPVTAERFEQLLMLESIAPGPGRLHAVPGGLAQQPAPGADGLSRRWWRPPVPWPSDSRPCRRATARSRERSAPPSGACSAPRGWLLRR